MKRRAVIKVRSLNDEYHNAKLQVEVLLEASGGLNADEAQRLICSICDRILADLNEHPYIKFSASMASVKLGTR